MKTKDYKKEAEEFLEEIMLRRRWTVEQRDIVAAYFERLVKNALTDNNK